MTGYRATDQPFKSAMPNANRHVPCRSQQREYEQVRVEHRVQGQTVHEKDLPRLPRGRLSYRSERGGQERPHEAIDTFLYELRVLSLRLRQLGDDCSHLLRRIEDFPTAQEQGNRSTKKRNIESKRRVHWSD